MKFTLSFFLISIFTFILKAQVVPIPDIQGSGDVSPYNNKTVSVKGAVTGVYPDGYFIRESSQPRAGIYIYDPGRSPKPALGDTVALTGLVTEYYNWTEIKTITAFEIISTDNPIPQPVALQTGQINEDWESCLVKVTSAVCTNTNLGYGEWEINDGSGKTVVNDLGYAYAPKLDQKYEITGPVSFSYGAYKIEPRNAKDVVILAPVYFTSALLPSEIATSSVTLTWETNEESTTELAWGYTTELEMGKIAVPGLTTTHQAAVDELDPSTVFYVRAFSVLEEDTAFSELRTFITQSTSSGEIRISFNRTYTDMTFTDSPELFTHNLADSLAFYIGLAETSLDLALYDFTNHAAAGQDFANPVITAINSARDRDVAIRLITDADVASAIVPYLDSNIPVFKVNHDGIMHHKFMVIDVQNPDSAWLITGSTNPNYNNTALDFNNLIAIQDQSLAKAYLMEFNQIWGGEGNTSDSLNSRSGSAKKEIVPHHFVIGGKNAELYFSPSDKTTSAIASTLAGAAESIDFAIMAFTENVLGTAIADAKKRGVSTRGIIDYVEYSGSEFDYLKAQGVDVLDYANPDGSGWPNGATLHHKFAVVDAGTDQAAVITGSHNWTAAAETRNDENTLIIHSREIADLFMEEFNRVRNWLMDPPVAPECADDDVELSTEDQLLLDVTTNDNITGAYTLEVTKDPKHGSAEVDELNRILYIPADNFTSGSDTLTYRVTIDSYPSFADSATVIIRKKTNTSAFNEINASLRVYPNPARDFINVYFQGQEGTPVWIKIVSISGQTLFEKSEVYPGYPLRIPSRDLEKGVYLISVETGMGEIVRKVIKE